MRSGTIIVPERFSFLEEEGNAEFLYSANKIFCGFFLRVSRETIILKARRRTFTQ